MNNWRNDAMRLADTGVSWRKIATEIGIPRSTVSDFLRKRASVSSVAANDEPVRVVAGRKHLIIADTQVKPGADLQYLRAVGNYIAEKRPDVIVHIGDHWDVPSLSSYDRGKRTFEGRRVRADILAGHEGMQAIIDPFKDISDYKPQMIFCPGNHEHRLDRFSNDNPEFDGLIGTEHLNIEQYGWQVFDFLQPAEVDGIHYVHYLSNPFSGKPYGGSALNQLKNVGTSFVVGHKQCLDIAIRPTLEGKMQIGIINGAYYPHDEEYKGHQGNAHFRGITVLHDVKEGFGEPMMVSLKYLVERYGY